MKLGSLGINQIMLLSRCQKRGYLYVSDVFVVYGFSSARHCSNSNTKALVVLQKLELYGLISRIPDKVPWAWILTEEGEKFLDERLNKSSNMESKDY